MRYSEQEMVDALTELNSHAKPVYGFLAGLIATTPALLMYYFLATGNRFVPIFFLAIPPAMIGLFARFVGRSYKLKHRLPIGLLGGMLHVLGCYALGFSPLIYVLTPVAFAISTIVAKTSMSEVHVWALDNLEIGRIKLDD